MSYQKIITETRRRDILTLLEEANGYDLNSGILQSALSNIGVSASVDQIHGDIAWLEEQALVTSRSTAGFQVATLTARGADVATGRASHPGVKRPSPGE